MAGNSKNYTAPFLAIAAGDMSSATLTSATSTISYLDNIAYQCNFTGSPVGTFSVKGSLDNVNFIPITLSAPAVASGSAGQVLINLNFLSFPYIQLVYTKTSGTGTLNAYYSGKAV